MSPAPPTMPRLLNVLGSHGSVSASDLERVVRTHREKGGCLADLLLREGLLDEEQLYYLLRRRLELPAISDARLRRLNLPPEAALRLPRALARDVQALPVAYEPGKGLLTVAMLDPSDAAAVERIRQAAKVGAVKPLLARRSPLAAMINQLYGDAGEVEVKTPTRPRPAALSGSGPGEPAGDGPSDAAPAAQEESVQIDPGLERDLEAMGEIPGMLEAPTKILKPKPAQRAALAAPPREEQTTPPMRPRSRQLVGRSLLKDGPPAPAPAPGEEEPPFPPVPESMDPEEATPIRTVPAIPRRRPAPAPIPDEETVELELDLESLEVEEEEMIAPVDLLPVTPVSSGPTPNLTPLPDVEQMEQLDALLGELFGSVGALVTLLEDRIQPAGATCKEYGQVARAVGLELGLSELTLSRVKLAATLCGLDRLLRREAGGEPVADPTRIFDPGACSQGGLSGRLRALGAHALGLGEAAGGAPDPLPAQVLRVVMRFLVMREESDLGAVDPDKMAETLRSEGHEAGLVDALVKAMEVTARTLVR